MSRTSERRLYEDVADRIGAMITNGAVRAGDRIPSIRSTSRRLSVSITTVIEAYRLLEDWGDDRATPTVGILRARGRLPPVRGKDRSPS